MASDGFIEKYSGSAAEAVGNRFLGSIHGTEFEEMPSSEQDLSLGYLKEAFASRGRTLDDDEMEALGLVRGGGYTQLARILSDGFLRSIYVYFVTVRGGRNRYTAKMGFTGSLLKQAREAYGYLMSALEPEAMEIDGLCRTDFHEFPKEAVGEAFLNAVLHRDYSFTGSVIVLSEDAGMTITSTGGIPNGLTERDALMGCSSPRNPNLVRIFGLVGAVERYGYGMRAIFEAYRDQPRQPKIETGPNTFRIFLPRITSVKRMDDEELKVLREADRKGSISRPDAERVLKCSRAKANRILAHLCESGRLYSQGSGRSVRYVLR